MLGFLTGIYFVNGLLFLCFSSTYGWRTLSPSITESSSLSLALSRLDCIDSCSSSTDSEKAELLESYSLSSSSPCSSSFSEMIDWFYSLSHSTGSVNKLS